MLLGGSGSTGGYALQVAGLHGPAEQLRVTGGSGGVHGARGIIKGRPDDGTELPRDERRKRGRRSGVAETSCIAEAALTRCSGQQQPMGYGQQPMGYGAPNQQPYVVHQQSGGMGAGGAAGAGCCGTSFPFPLSPVLISISVPTAGPGRRVQL